MDLQQRLSQVAEASRDGFATRTPSSPVDVWEAGRRQHRRRVVGTVAIAVVLVLGLAGVGAAALLRPTAEVQPATPVGARPALPDRMYEPSPGLPGTADGGPLGPLALLLLADRDTSAGRAPELVGVSATSGQYRFLDLPGFVRAPADQAALSPSGTRLAYWTGEDLPDDDAHVTGVAVYDPRAGTIVSAPIATRHGIEPNGLIWVRDSTLVVTFGQRTGDPGGSLPARALVWRAGSGAPVPMPLSSTDVEAHDFTATAGDAIAYLHRGCHVIDARTGSEMGPTGGAGCAASTADPSGRRLVVGSRFERGGVTVSGPRLLTIVPTTRGGGAGQRRPVRGVDVSDVFVAWVDDSRLAVAHGFRVLRSRRSLDELDLTSGKRHQIVVLPRGGQGSSLVVGIATRLLGRPTVPGVRPPDRTNSTQPDSRPLAGAAVGLVLAALAALLVWRRRVRL